MCKWTDVEYKEMPKRENTERNSWKPDGEDIAAMYEVLIGNTQVKVCNMGDRDAARNKAKSMLGYILNNRTLSEVITAIAVDKAVVIYHVNDYEKWCECHE